MFETEIDGFVGYAVCEQCHKLFELKKPVHRYVNAQASGTVADDFFAYKFNRVKCKHCNVEFNYEMPIVVYNKKDKYVIFTSNNISNASRAQRLYEILDISDLKIYHVPYYAFAVEVVNTYRYGLSYDDIIDIRNKQLGADKLDITKEYIVFNKFENNILYYHHLNFLNQVERVYEIKYDNREIKL